MRRHFAPAGNHRDAAAMLEQATDDLAQLAFHPPNCANVVGNDGYVPPVVPRRYRSGHQP
jgi:hypothetical protein